MTRARVWWMAIVLLDSVLTTRHVHRQNRQYTIFMRKTVSLTDVSCWFQAFEAHVLTLREGVSSTICAPERAVIVCQLRVFRFLLWDQ